jgi:sulfur carrier protein
MTIWLNGEEKQLNAGGKLTETLSQMGIDDTRGVAIAVDGEVIPKSEWETVTLADGQRVEVVRAVQGGSK